MMRSSSWGQRERTTTTKKNVKNNIKYFKNDRYVSYKIKLKILDGKGFRRKCK